MSQALTRSLELLHSFQFILSVLCKILFWTVVYFTNKYTIKSKNEIWACSSASNIKDLIKLKTFRGVWTPSFLYVLLNVKIYASMFCHGFKTISLFPDRRNSIQSFSSSYNISSLYETHFAPQWSLNIFLCAFRLVHLSWRHPFLCARQMITTICRYITILTLWVRLSNSFLLIVFENVGKVLLNC